MSLKIENFYRVIVSSSNPITIPFPQTRSLCQSVDRNKLIIFRIKKVTCADHNGNRNERLQERNILRILISWTNTSWHRRTLRLIINSRFYLFNEIRSGYQFYFYEISYIFSTFPRNVSEIRFATNKLNKAAKCLPVKGNDNSANVKVTNTQWSNIS